MTMPFRVQKELPRQRTAVRGEPVDWEGARAALIEHEGDWVCIAENVHSSTGDQLRRGEYKQFPAEEIDSFEFTARKPKRPDPDEDPVGYANFVPYANRRTDIWGRYTAPKKGRRK